MKSRRILAAVLAPVCAVSAMAVGVSASAEAVNVSFDYELKITGADGTVKIDEAETFTGETADDGTADVARPTYEDCEFAPDDVITASITVPEGVDSSAVQVAISGFNMAWGGWNGELCSEEGVLEFETTVAAVMEANEIDDVADLQGLCLWVYKASAIAPAEDETPAGDDTSDETPAGDDTSDETPADTSDETPADTSDETSAGDDTSDETPADTSDDTAEPGDTEKAPVVVEADIKDVDSKNGIEGEALDALVLVKDGKTYTWADVESIVFSSDKLFSVQFAANKEVAGTDWFTMGKDAVPAAKADDDMWATEWTLGSEEFKLFDTTKTNKGYVKLLGKEDGTNINVKVTMKADAEGKPAANDSDTTSGSNNANTGIALAVAPVILAGAAAAVVVIGKKRK